MNTVIANTGKPTLAELQERNRELKTENHSLKGDARKLLSTFDSMKGQLVALTDGVAEIKEVSPEIWEQFFGKSAKNRRKKKRKEQGKAA